MAESKRLRTRELRGLYHLLGECCELGADPVAWRKHLAERLPVLFNCQAAQFFEVEVVGRPFEDPYWLRPLFIADYGWATESDRKHFEAHLDAGRPEQAPHITPDILGRKLKVVRWSANPSLSEWRESAFFNDVVKHGHLDDGMYAQDQTEPGKLRMLSINRALGDHPFGQRDNRLLKLLNVELARLLGRKVARLGEPTVMDLPPRQRQVLICLMQGDTERQTAIQLGLSPHTVHDYVKSLHTRFGVRSRAELLCRCRKLWPVLEREVQPDNNGNGSNVFRVKCKTA